MKKNERDELTKLETENEKPKAKKLELTIADERAWLDGVMIYLGTAPYEQNNEIYLPYTEICRIFQFNIKREGNKIIIER